MKRFSLDLRRALKKDVPCKGCVCVRMYVCVWGGEEVEFVVLVKKYF